MPFPPGGSVDGVARILVQKLNETVGQHFIVENRASGASGIVGANAVAKAPPDGYTLLVSASVHVINPFLYKTVPYDVVKDFTPLMLLCDGPLIVSTTPSVPANNLKDFFDLVRKEPQKFTFDATTIGSASHLAIELQPLLDLDDEPPPDPEAVIQLMQDDAEHARDQLDRFPEGFYQHPSLPIILARLASSRGCR